jgi:hypothetical protein
MNREVNQKDKIDDPFDSSPELMVFCAEAQYLQVILCASGIKEPGGSR